MPEIKLSDFCVLKCLNPNRVSFFMYIGALLQIVLEFVFQGLCVREVQLDIESRSLVFFPELKCLKPCTSRDPCSRSFTANSMKSK